MVAAPTPPGSKVQWWRKRSCGNNTTKIEHVFSVQEWSIQQNACCVISLVKYKFAWNFLLHYVGPKHTKVSCSHKVMSMRFASVQQKILRGTGYLTVPNCFRSLDLTIPISWLARSNDRKRFSTMRYRFLEILLIDWTRANLDFKMAYTSR